MEEETIVFEFESKKLSYKINLSNSNTVSVIGVDEEDRNGSIVMPSQITYKGKTYTVTSIGSFAFFNCDSLTNIMLPNSITSIGCSAFEDCSSLTSITIPNSVTEIAKFAFAYCRNLTSITIPNSCVSIDDTAFFGCSRLTIIKR